MVPLALNCSLAPHDQLVFSDSECGRSSDVAFSYVLWNASGTALKFRTMGATPRTDKIPVHRRRTEDNRRLIGIRQVDNRRLAQSERAALKVRRCKGRYRYLGSGRSKLTRKIDHAVGRIEVQTTWVDAEDKHRIFVAAAVAARVAFQKSDLVV
jgi:hypothetical protein